MIMFVVLYINLFGIDQLNITVHGTMKTTPYELVFGQPPRQCLFPGASTSRILEEDVENLLNDSDDHPPNDDLTVGNNEGTCSLHEFTLLTIIILINSHFRTRI